MEVTYEKYNEAKSSFFKKHKNDFHISTTPLNTMDCWGKMYAFEDGAMWYECYRPVFEEVEVEVHLCKVKVEAKLLETEFWSSDNSKSQYYYERY